VSLIVEHMLKEPRLRWVSAGFSTPFEDRLRILAEYCLAQVLFLGNQTIEDYRSKKMKEAKQDWIRENLKRGLNSWGLRLTEDIKIVKSLIENISEPRVKNKIEEMIKEEGPYEIDLSSILIGIEHDEIKEELKKNPYSVWSKVYLELISEENKVENVKVYATDPNYATCIYTLKFRASPEECKKFGKKFMKELGKVDELKKYHYPSEKEMFITPSYEIQKEIATNVFCSQILSNCMTLMSVKVPLNERGAEVLRKFENLIRRFNPYTGKFERELFS
jgi:hypothetical protein